MEIKIEIDDDLTKEVKTRIPHDCISCGQVIPAKQQARAVSYRTDNGRKLYKVYQHAECAKTEDAKKIVVNNITQSLQG